MTESERAKITEDQLRMYAARMRQHFATPFFCVGVGQNERTGQAVTCLPPDAPMGLIIKLLEDTLTLLKKANR